VVPFELKGGPFWPAIAGFGCYV
jgi:hypothetical protein